jgi:hypothetical protein
MIRNYAVFTGDLIKSSNASRSRAEATIACISDTAARIGRIIGKDTRFTRFRGDGWQMVIEEPGAFLLASVLIVARLRMGKGLLKTRASIGVGPVDTLGTEDLRDAAGFAFTISGRGLDATGRDRDWVMSSTPDDPVGLLGNKRLDHRLLGDVDWYDSVLLNLVMFNAGKWTAAQAEAIALALENDDETQGKLANRLGITRQALNLRLTAAGYSPIRGAIVFSRLMAGNQEETKDTP